MANTAVLANARQTRRRQICINNNYTRRSSRGRRYTKLESLDRVQIQAGHSIMHVAKHLAGKLAFRLYHYTWLLYYVVDLQAHALWPREVVGATSHAKFLNV